MVNCTAWVSPTASRSGRTVWGRGWPAGLYGIRLGRVFYGESMFSRVDNASKVGFVTLVDHLVSRWGVGLIDCQAPTAYLASFGAKEMPRDWFLERLRQLIEFPGNPGTWTTKESS